jgi:hypothetical protein
MADYGSPVSYLVLEPGAPVHGSDGEQAGTVEHVLAIPDDDIFDGIVIKIHDGLLKDELRFADAPFVDGIYERGVVLTIAADAVETLPEPSENPAVLEAGPDDTVPDGLRDKLRRAWDLISGNY